MRWLDKNRGEGVYADEREIELEGKEIWIFLVSEENRGIFERLGRSFLSTDSPPSISVLWENPTRWVWEPSPLSRVIESCDLFFVDAAFMLAEPQTKLMDGLGYHMSRRRGSYFLFYERESDINAITSFLKDPKTRHAGCPSFEPFVPERDKILQFKKGMSDAEFEDIFGRLQTSIAALHGRTVFLCHAGEDWLFTRSLAQALGKASIPVWCDRWSMRVGDSIPERVDRAIGHCKFMAVILSKSSVEKRWCHREVNAALSRRLDDETMTILPVLLDDCQIPPALADTNYADFRESFQDGFRDLLRAIRSK